MAKAAPYLLVVTHESSWYVNPVVGHDEFYMGYQGNPMRFRSAVWAACIGLAAVVGATAADAQVVGQKQSSLYVRGDIGGAFSTHTEFKDTDASAPNASLGTTQLAGDSGNSVLMEGGLGLQLNPLLRFDAVGMILPFFKFRTTSNTQPQASANIVNWTGLLNGYVELNHLLHGLFGTAEPYIDAGIGFADNQTDHLQLASGGSTTVFDATDHFNLAWAAGGGIGFPITRDLKLDVAYRFLSLGSIETGTNKTVNGVTSGTTVSKADLNAHTVMLGLRYTFYNFNAF
jgi:opacity protein-like surface antigen